MTEDVNEKLKELEAIKAGLSVESAPAPAVSEGPEEENSFCIKNGAYIRISEDGMEAYIYLNPPKEGEKDYSRSDIARFIHENNVTRGLHESNISAIAKKHVYQREILIARGQLPVEGKAGWYEYLFDTSDKRTPAIREDGTVDYSSMSRLST